MTCQAYLKKFRNSVEVIEHCGGDLGTDSGLIKATLASATVPVTMTTATPDVLEAAKKYDKAQYLACTFLLGADRKIYGRLLENLENDFTQKTDRWLKTINNAYSLLVNWKQDPRNLMQVLWASSDGVAFTNVEQNKGTALATVKKDKDKPPDIATIKCFECKEMSHYSNSCRKKTGVHLLMAGVESGEFDDSASTGRDLAKNLGITLQSVDG
jgi:hypothetical protein